MNAGVDQKELTFRLARPDIKDWFLVVLGVLCLFLIVYSYLSAVSRGKDWSNWFVIPGGAMILLSLSCVPRFIGAQYRLVLSSEEISLWKGKKLENSFLIKGSMVQGSYLWPDPTLENRTRIPLPAEWVGRRPERLVAIWALLDRGARLKSLMSPEDGAVRNPRFIEVVPAGRGEVDSSILIGASLLFGFWGFGAAILHIVGIYSMAFAAVVLVAGILLQQSNNTADDQVPADGYAIDESRLKASLTSGGEVLIDLTLQPLVITCKAGATAHFIRVGIKNEDKEVIALTHWQGRTTGDINQLVLLALASGTKPKLELLLNKSWSFIPFRRSDK